MKKIFFGLFGFIYVAFIIVPSSIVLGVIEYTMFMSALTLLAIPAPFLYYFGELPFLYLIQMVLSAISFVSFLFVMGLLISTGSFSIVAASLLSGVYSAPVIVTSLIGIVPFGLFIIYNLYHGFFYVVPWGVDAFIYSQIEFKQKLLNPLTITKSNFLYIFESLRGFVFDTIVVPKLKKKREDTVLARYIDPTTVLFAEVSKYLIPNIAETVLDFIYGKIIKLSNHKISPVWIADQYTLVFMRDDEPDTTPEPDTIYLREINGSLCYTCITTDGDIVNHIPLPHVAIDNPITFDKLYAVKLAIENDISFNKHIRQNTRDVMPLQPEHSGLIKNMVNGALSLIQKFFNLPLNITETQMTKKDAEKTLWNYFGSQGCLTHQFYLSNNHKPSEMKKEGIYLFSEEDKKGDKTVSYSVLPKQSSDEAPVLTIKTTYAASARFIADEKQRSPHPNSLFYQNEEKDTPYEPLTYAILRNALKEGHTHFFRR